jgi:hypothetical protein
LLEQVVVVPDDRIRGVDIAERLDVTGLKASKESSDRQQCTTQATGTDAGPRPASAAADLTIAAACPASAGDIRLRITPSAIRPASASIRGPSAIGRAEQAGRRLLAPSS